jgi:hypothetical protein
MKLRFQFFGKFSESQNLCFHVSESKEPMVLNISGKKSNKLP